MSAPWPGGAALAAELLRAGDARGALDALSAEVRSRPNDAALRIFLAQLLCVLGEWKRADSQVELAASLDAAAIPLRYTMQAAIRCEPLRAQVYAGRRAPMVFGEPPAWLALLIESRLRAGRGEPGHAAALQAQALEDAPAVPGTLNDEPFAWLADADARLGPVLEAIIEGRYYWLPLERLDSATFEAPQDLRDTVWLPAHLRFSNGGETVALVPVRYPGSEYSEDSAIRLARRTEWAREPGAGEGGGWLGVGQRMLVTDRGEYGLLDVRSIVLNGGQPAPEAGVGDGDG